MDTNEVRALCLKHVYGASLTEAERTLVDEYAQTSEGKDYLRESREMKGVLNTVADIQIKPVDHQAMIQRFEHSVRQSFKETVFRRRGEAYGLPILLGLCAGLSILVCGWHVINTVSLGLCALWSIAAWAQRRYFSRILSKSDLYEYAKASRSRSEKLLRSPIVLAILAVISGLAIAAVSYGAHWSYLEFGLIVTAIPIALVASAVATVVYHHRKLRRSDPQLWDWWEEEIQE